MKRLQNQSLITLPGALVNPHQLAKAEAFKALHQSPGTFIIPNPWDAGSARLLEVLGFKALATSSAGLAFSKGKTDNHLSRAQVLAHLTELTAAATLPISADLENGFGEAPAVVAETIRLAAETGIAGGSIEDSTGVASQPLFDIELAKDRVRAAVEAARALPVPFTLTARAENFFVGRPDLSDTIRRLQAYQDAGADVLFAPGLRTLADIETVVRSVDRPVNVLMGMAGVHITLDQLADLGVKRISVGGSLARTALGAFIRAAQEMRDQGTFTYAEDAIPMATISQMLA
jgi:2-methylisocitrate lyase-like PEP mutase family enzyme